MAEHSQDEYISVPEAAALLGIPPAAVRRLLRQYGLGELMRASMGRQVLVRRADIEKLMGPSPKVSRRSGAA